MKDKQAELFDKLAVHDCLYRYTPDALASIGRLVPHKGCVLDMGCGDGTLGTALAADIVVGLDISERCARLAGRNGIQGLVGDAIRGMPFSGASFDAVYCIDVLHHLGQAWEPIFAEIDRILKPGGNLVIVEPDARNRLVRWTQAPRSPLRVAPFDNEPAIDPHTLLPHLLQRGYTCDCEPFCLDARQVVRNVFPFWQRLLKAPFVLALAAYCHGQPRKFLIRAQKP